MVFHTCYLGGGNRGIVVRVQPYKRCDTLSEKQTKNKWDGGRGRVAQVSEHLPSKHKALSSKPSEEEERREGG
jgi:hypothetical protein